MSLAIDFLTSVKAADFVQNSSAQVLSEGCLKAVGRPVFTLADKTATKEEKRYSATKEFLYQSMSMLAYFLMISPVKKNSFKLLKKFPQFDKYLDDNNIKNALNAKNNNEYKNLLQNIENKDFLTKAKGAQELISIITSAFILTVVTPQIVNRIVHPIMDKFNAINNKHNENKLDKIV